MKKEIPVLELTDYLVTSDMASLGPFDFTVLEKEIWILDTDFPEKARLFFQALATLTAPARGTYYFFGRRIDFTNYQHLLAFKKKIGYISPAISLISNRTIRENLLLPEYYEQEALFLPLTPEIEQLCRLCGLTRRLDCRATAVDQWESRTSLTIRELTKNPSILLVDRPEEMVPPEKRSQLLDLLTNRVAAGKPVVFYSRNKKYIDNLSPAGRIKICEGEVTVTAHPCTIP